MSEADWQFKDGTIQHFAEIKDGKGPLARGYLQR